MITKLFEKEYRTAEEKLYKKGYHVSNMIYTSDFFEVCDEYGKVLIDNLSLSQLCQLSEIL